MQDLDLVLHFQSELERHGPGMLRVTLKSPSFDDFTPENRQTGGASYFFCDIYQVRTIAEVDEMFMRVEAAMATVCHRYRRQDIPTDK